MEFMKKYLAELARQPSTWRGVLIVLAGIIGFELSTTAAGDAASALVTLAGIIGAAILDRKNDA